MVQVQLVVIKNNNMDLCWNLLGVEEIKFLLEIIRGSLFRMGINLILGHMQLGMGLGLDLVIVRERLLRRLIKVSIIDFKQHETSATKYAKKSSYLLN